MFNLPESQIGLRQFGNTPFYHTPNTAASPYDCNRYPNSPFCGGNPINKDNAVGFDYEFVFDECNLGVEITPTFGYIILPSTQIVYRHSNCSPPPPPPPTREPRYENEPSTTIYNPLNPGNVWIGSNPYYLFYEDGVGRDRIPDGYAYDERVQEIIEYSEFLSYQLPNGSYSTHRIVSKVTQILKRNSSWMKSFRGVGISVEQSTIDDWVSRGGSIDGNPQDDGTMWTLIEVKNSTYYLNADSFNLDFAVINDGVNFPGGNLYFFRQDEIPEGENQFSYTIGGGVPLFFRDPTALPIDVISDYEPREIAVTGDGEDTLGSFYTAEWYSVTSTALTYKFIQLGSDTSPPPPPPRKKRKDDMNCCQNNDQLLRLILKRIGPLPASVPNSLIRANSGIKTINSLAEYIAYSVIQANAQFGQFPQEINIQDADLTQEGNQSRKVTLPNLAESIAEIIGMLLVLQSESNANLIATINAMIEAGNAKQLALLASDYAAANAEFLGYKGKQVEHKVPFTFKPGEPQLDKMLKNGEVKVKGFENDDKNDLSDLLMPLLEMAAMYRAQNFRNVGTGDTANKLKGIFRGAVALSDAVELLSKFIPPDPNNPDAPQPTPKVDEWDAFIEGVEQGFISQPGITDSLNPYGRPLEQRPKIRDIGQDTSEDT